MSRRMPNIPEGSILLTPNDARVLYQVANLKAVRSKFRAGDTFAYALLTEITVCAFTSDAGVGNEPRHESASEEREWWTTAQVARAARRAGRTVRLDIEREILPAQKTGSRWLIRADDVERYIKAHRRSAS